MRDDLSTATAKALARTQYGTRVEVARQAGWRVGWSNNLRSWGRFFRAVKRGDRVTLDANEILLYGPARYVDGLAKRLPYLPLYQYSTEARDRGLMGPGSPLDPERFTSNPRPPSPEEEWLGGEESGDEGPTGEGDLAPWMQPGGGSFPMESRVHYINAYTLVEYRTSIGFQDNLRKYGSSHKVGVVTPGIEIGSDAFYTPFASIPVRNEDEKAQDFFFAYIEWLVKGVNIGFTRIETEESFPRGEFNQYSNKVEARVTLADGRWFPFETTKPFHHPQLHFLNAFSVNRVLGGREEGGWWYDEGIALASIPFKRGNELTEQKFRSLMQNAIGWHSKYKLDSVLGRDEFRMYTENTFAADFPTEKPHYE